MSSLPGGQMQRSRRAGKACEFCRRRKLKCDTKTPQCGNCQSYQERCVYSTATPQPRPTRAAIAALQAENRRLHLQAAVASPPEDSASPPTTDPQPQSSPNPNATSPDSQGRAAPAAMTSASTYHGPTSTLFDDTSNERPSRSWFSEERESWMPKLLFAEAARQRQLEGVNASALSLDFDGVDSEIGLHLLNLHWNRQHHSFLVTYRPAFMRDMACNGPYFSKILLNSIYYGASKFSPRLELRKDPNDVRTAGWRFRQRVRELLGQSLDHSKVTTIQALLQMTNSLFALGDEQSAAWLYSGTAFRMIIDLGLHIDATLLPALRGISDEDLEIRRRVFWSAFVIDKIQSLYQGRPATLQASKCQVPISFHDEYEELEQWLPFAYSSDPNYSGSPSYSVSTFTQLCKLCIILNAILNKIYNEKQSIDGSDKLTAELDSLENDLHSWADALPSHLKLNFDADPREMTIPPPHVLSLLAIYNVLRILLHRPFVSDGHLHSISPSIAVTSFKACASAATNITKLVRLYDRAFKIHRAPYLISYATYVAATIHVRIASRLGSSSEAYECLRVCLSVFEQNSETNYAVRKADAVIRKLMTRMDVAEPTAHSGSVSGTNLAGSDRIRNEATLENGGTAIQPKVPTKVSSDAAIVSDESPPGFDVDAIIQSFMRESHTGNSAQASDSQAAPFLYEWAQWPAPETSWTGVNGNQQRADWFSDDMLFGFNTSTFDV